MKVDKLKEKARRHEQREEWQKAFDLYRSALRLQDEDEPPDITLFNRLGDLQTRLGRVTEAVEHYEKAIELYLEAELPNNAIAICKKVIRNLPDRDIFYLRMGQIRAGQGFLTDARHNFLAFAEKRTAGGDIESALSALVEFVDISPEDVEIRLGLAAQLESHDRTEEAVGQYTEAYHYLILADKEAEAATVSGKLQELAPDVPLPDPEALRADAAAVETGELILESTNLGGMGYDRPASETADGFLDLEMDFGAELESRQEADKEASPGADDALGVESFEAPEEGGLVPEPGLLTDLGMGEDVSEPEEEGGEEDLPTFGFQEEAEEDGVEPLPTLGFEEDWKEGGDALPTFGFEEEADEDLAPLPTLDLDGGEGGPLEEGDVEATLDGLLESAIEGSVEDSAFEASLDEVEEAEPEEEVGLPGLEGPPLGTDHQTAAEEGDLDGAIEMIRTLILEEPENLDHHQRYVEYAFRTSDESVLVSAYLELAACLARTGSPVKAKAVYQQVLSLSPGHAGAVEGMEALDGVSGAKPPAQVASSEEYVDLGSLILGEEAEKTTRWKVTADAPSGDEEADFAKMLGQFKEKVSEHVAADDVSAHHDLGTAYMEMGLMDEAISEFQMALRASPHHLPTHEVMGRCWMEMGKADMAVRALDRALRVGHEVEDELIGIYYLMGRAQEDQGNTPEALEFYEKVFSLDINFEDVTERLRALR